MNATGRRQHLPAGGSSCRAAALAALTVAAMVGCRQVPFDYVEVSGRVTYTDGTPIPAQKLKVVFVPLTPPRDAKTHPRPGIAFPDKDGSFPLVTSLTYADGICAGKHKVTVHALDGNDAETAAVPERYRDPETTPLEVDAAEGRFELKVEKPGGGARSSELGARSN